MELRLVFSLQSYKLTTFYLQTFFPTTHHTATRQNTRPFPINPPRYILTPAKLSVTFKSLLLILANFYDSPNNSHQPLEFTPSFISSTIPPLYSFLKRSRQVVNMTFIATILMVLSLFISVVSNYYSNPAVEKRADPYLLIIGHWWCSSTGLIPPFSFGSTISSW